MEADHHIIEIDRHVWTLKAPAHHTEVDKTMSVANQERSLLTAGGSWAGDVFLSGDDQHVVVSFDARRPDKTTTSAALDADEEVRTDG
ncbi:hypothetical protein [Streptomyces sp. NPDC001914]|uniref:hypothetical protein n=1 Tax=Streptomyces sp. NPDC001914 TaxID=3364623 RepID=UPI003696DB00